MARPLFRVAACLATAFAAATVLPGCSVEVEGDPICFDYCPGQAQPVPSPTYAVYVANNIDGAGSVSAYTSDNATGILTPVAGSPFPAGANPLSMLAVNDTNGALVYVANSSGSSVSAYVASPATGSLSAIAGSPFSTGPGTFPCSVAIGAAAQLHVASSSTDTVLSFRILPQAPRGGLSGPGASVATGAMPLALAVHPTRKFAYVANSAANTISVYAVDPASGSLSSTGAPVPAGTGPASLAIDPAGNFLYAANFGSNDVSAYSVDRITGALTAIGSVPAGLGPVFVSLYPAEWPGVYYPSARFLYAANVSSNNISVYSIDARTGALTSIGAPVAAGISPRSITVRTFSNFLYVANAGSADVSSFRIDERTGALTSLGARVPAGANAFSIANVRMTRPFF